MAKTEKMSEMMVNESKKSNPHMPTECIWMFRKYKLQRLPTAIVNKRTRGLIFLVISSIKPTAKAGKHKIGIRVVTPKFLLSKKSFKPKPRINQIKIPIPPTREVTVR
jgi:hypothetical protein